MHAALLGAAGCWRLMSVAAPAQAALTLCNRTSYILYAATSAIQARDSQTQGWTRIAPGDCQIARKEPLTAQSYLVYARSALAHSGPARAWGGNQSGLRQGREFHHAARRRRSPTAPRTIPSRCPSRRWTITASAIWTMNFDEQPALPP